MPGKNDPCRSKQRPRRNLFDGHFGSRYRSLGFKSENPESSARRASRTGSKFDSRLWKRRIYDLSNRTASETVERMGFRRHFPGKNENRKRSPKQFKTGRRRPIGDR